MQTFKRMLVSILVFVAAFIGISAAIAVPYLNSELDYFQDRAHRAELAGSIDTLVIGSSQLFDGVDPCALDEAAGCSSFNLSFNSSPMYARKVLIEKELERNPVKTVVLGISFNSMSKASTDSHCDGDLYAIAKLDNLGEVGAYVVQNLTFDEAVDLYAWVMNRGVAYWSRLLTGRYESGVDHDVKDYAEQTAVDLTALDDSERWSVLPQTISCDFNASSIQEFRDIAQICRDHGARLVVVQAPLSNWALTHVQGWDEFDSAVQSLCDSEDVTYLNFNLNKVCRAQLDDATSFHEENHLSGQGAAIFTDELGACLALLNAGDDVSSRFYSSYAQLS